MLLDCTVDSLTDACGISDVVIDYKSKQFEKELSNYDFALDATGEVSLFWVTNDDRTLLANCSVDEM